MTTLASLERAPMEWSSNANTSSQARWDRDIRDWQFWSCFFTSVIKHDTVLEAWILLYCLLYSTQNPMMFPLSSPLACLSPLPLALDSLRVPLSPLVIRSQAVRGSCLYPEYHSSLQAQLWKAPIVMNISYTACLRTGWLGQISENKIFKILRLWQ